MNQDEIDKAVESCLAYAAKTQRPFQHLADLLLALKTSGWPQDAMLEVQNRFIEGLSKRHVPLPGSSRPAPGST